MALHRWRPLLLAFLVLSPFARALAYPAARAPGRVAPGERSTIECSFTAARAGSATFTYGIRSDGRDLLQSKPEAVAAAGGVAVLVAKTLAAGIDTGTFGIHVQLTLGDAVVERETILIVGTRR
jgi:hypothetical protein